MFGRCHITAPVDEESWTGVTNPSQPVPRPFRLPAQSLELATRPASYIGIDPLQGRAQLLPTEMAVAVDPALDARIVYLGQIVQGLVATMMKLQLRIVRLMAFSAFGLAAGLKE